LEQHLLPLSLALVGALSVSACALRPSVAPLAETPAQESGDAPTSNANSEASGAELVPASKSSSGAPATGTTTATSSDPASYDFPKETLILHVGDSFAGSLGVPLGKRFKAAGMRTVLEFQTASYVPTWASGKELPGYINKFSPSLVIITLGANEVELTNPEQRASAVKRLVGKLGGRPCVWVIPPLWKPDTGIFKVIRENVAPCRVLESDSIVRDLPLRKDKIHPSDEAREVWADAVLAWLARERAGTAERPWELRPAP